MKAFRAISIALASAFLASVLLRFLPLPLPTLALSVAIVAGIAAVASGISERVAAAGGALTAVLVAVILALTLNAAEVAPGAHRPGLRDLLWKPLAFFAVSVLACAFSGWLSARIALLLSRKARQ